MWSWLDREAGPERALIPASGVARDLAMQRIALACGGVEKIGAAAYERIIRPNAYRWPEWIARCRVQGEGALAALDRLDWPAGARFDQAVISTGCFLSYVRMADPELMPAGKYKNLDDLNARCEARREFRETAVSEYAGAQGHMKFSWSCRANTSPRHFSGQGRKKAPPSPLNRAKKVNAMNRK